MSFNYVDIAIIVILAFFAFKGLKNGFLQEFAVLLGIFVGFFLAKQYAGDLLPYIKFNIDENVLYCLAFGVIVIVTLIIASLVARLLSSLLDLAFLGFLDHALGALFGVFKGLVVICLLMYVVQLFLDLPMIKSAAFYPYYHKLLDIAQTFFNNNPDLIPSTL